MILAAVSFGDPVMLAGLLAAFVPVLLHLLNRIRAPVVTFPTLRFLRVTAQKTARRRHIQQYFLLLVRVIVFALIAMAVAAPLIRGGSAGLAYGFVVMALGGLVLLVLAGVLSAAAVDKSKTAAAHAHPGEPAARPRRSAAPYWAFSLAAILAALLLGGYSAYGLISDRYFSGDRGEFTGRSTAAVIILDNSHSMLATEDSRTRLARAKDQARQLLADTIRPAEAAILPTNPGEQPPPPLTTDSTRLLGYLDGLEPRGAARPMQERIGAALQMLRASGQPNKMLVLVSDFVRPAFADAEVFSAIKNLSWRNDLQIVFVPIRKARDTGAIGDVGVASFGLAEGMERPVLGAQVTFEAQVVNSSDAADVRDLELTVDGQPAADSAARQRVQMGAAGTPSARAAVRIPMRLEHAGMHRYGVRLVDAHDAMAWDDQREVVLDVADQVNVLVIGGELAAPGGAPRSRTAAFYFQAALAPFEGTGAKVPWAIKPAYKNAADVQNFAALQGNAAVFLCDVPKISPALADALVQYAKGGGRIVWVLGPTVDAAAYNQVLRGQNRDLLPAPLGQPLISAKAWPLDWVDVNSGLFANLFDSQEPFRSALIIGRWALDGDLSRGRVLAKLSDGSPVFIQHSPASGAGAGQVFTLLSSPGGAWSNLGATVLLVPLASRMVLGDFHEGSTNGSSPESYETGQTVTIRIPGLTAAPGAAASGLDVTTPDTTVLNVRAAAPGPGGAPQWFFDRTFTQGLYRWKFTGPRGDSHEGIFVVNPPGEEADLQSADIDALAKESSPGIATAGGGKQTIVAFDAPELLTQLQQRSEGTSLTPGFLSMVLILAVVEALMANRYRPTPPTPSTFPIGSAAPASQGVVAGLAL